MDWQDPSFKQKQDKAKPEKAAEEKEHLLCTNCGKRYYIKFPDHCRCSVWDVGRRPNAQDPSNIS